MYVFLIFNFFVCLRGIRVPNFQKIIFRISPGHDRYFYFVHNQWLVAHPRRTTWVIYKRKTITYTPWPNVKNNVRWTCYIIVIANEKYVFNIRWPNKTVGFRAEIVEYEVVYEIAWVSRHFYC